MDCFLIHTNFPTRDPQTCPRSVDIMPRPDGSNADPVFEAELAKCGDILFMFGHAIPYIRDDAMRGICVGEGEHVPLLLLYPSSAEWWGNALFTYSEDTGNSNIDLYSLAYATSTTTEQDRAQLLFRADATTFVAFDEEPAPWQRDRAIVHALITILREGKMGGSGTYPEFYQSGVFKFDVDDPRYASLKALVERARMPQPAPVPAAPLDIASAPSPSAPMPPDGLPPIGGGETPTAPPPQGGHLPSMAAPTPSAGLPPIGGGTPTAPAPQGGPLPSMAAPTPPAGLPPIGGGAPTAPAPQGGPLPSMAAPTPPAGLPPMPAPGMSPVVAAQDAPAASPAPSDDGQEELHQTAHAPSLGPADVLLAPAGPSAPKETAPVSPAPSPEPPSVPPASDVPPAPAVQDAPTASPLSSGRASRIPIAGESLEARLKAPARGLELALLSATAAGKIVILGGPSGTGKTRLAMDMARALCDDDGQTILSTVTARPGWQDPRCLLDMRWDSGAPEGGDFEGTPLWEALERCGEDPARRALILLSEMDVAMAERYLADVLIAMDLPGGASIPCGRGRSCPWPTLSRIIGTANADEGTFRIGSKLLDRSFYIRSRPSDTSFEPPTGDGLSLGEHVARANALARGEPGDVLGRFAGDVAEDLDIEGLLMAVDMIPGNYTISLAHRVRDDIYAFIAAFLHVAGHGAYDRDAALEALDWAIVSKILPKFHGIKEDLDPPLGALERELQARGLLPQGPVGHWPWRCKEEIGHIRHQMAATGRASYR